MNISINERFKEYCSSNELSQTDLVKKLGIGKDRLSKWFNENQQIPGNAIIIIVQKCKDLNARWLITGEGNMITDKKETSEEPASPYIAKCKNPFCEVERKYLKDQIENLLKDKEFLQQTIADIRGKGGHQQGEFMGGVESPGKTG